MGVLARLLRRSKTAEETSTAEASADSPTAEPEAEETAEANEPAEGSGRVPEAIDGESVEIPKQQSTDEAADREAGEGART
ncbi:hypothetical protein [Streptomyces sp. P17]|uniref:hypothetical protein n=1 Tax=Streptomyces sp. P17 TaxID=3074716 RepID=UPI0028F4114B|nr:hypothetical protein [Streptomyces sp. P17]MDT9694772.1 hypothetical protein [Streptomyces sp. P17]